MVEVVYKGVYSGAEHNVKNGGKDPASIAWVGEGNPMARWQNTEQDALASAAESIAIAIARVVLAWVARARDPGVGGSWTCTLDLDLDLPHRTRLVSSVFVLTRRIPYSRTCARHRIEGRTLDYSLLI